MALFPSNQQKQKNKRNVPSFNLCTYEMITIILLLSKILLLNNGVRLVNGQCPYSGTSLVDDTTYASYGGNNSKKCKQPYQLYGLATTSKWAALIKMLPISQLLPTFFWPPLVHPMKIYHSPFAKSLFKRIVSKSDTTYTCYGLVNNTYAFLNVKTHHIFVICPYIRFVFTFRITLNGSSFLITAFSSQ